MNAAAALRAADPSALGDAGVLLRLGLLILLGMLSLQ